MSGASVSPESQQLLALRLSMLPNQPAAAIVQEQASAITLPTTAADLKGVINALSSTARTIVMELRRGDAVHGIWTFTARDLNVPIDLEALVSLQNRFERTLPGVRSFAAQSAVMLSEKFPSVVKLSFLDELRQWLSATPSLPLYVSDSLRRTLDSLDRDRKVLWLEFKEPTGFLPWLAWEEMLRTVVGVPIVRAGRQPVDAVAPRGSLDVLVAVTCCHPIPGAPGSVAALCRQILRGLPAPGRCVIHLCADILHREAIRYELETSGMVMTEREEPPGRRGVVLYPLPTANYASSRASDTTPSEDALLEHQWPRWIRECMHGRGLDVIHVISEAGFPALHPSLEVAAIPWEQPKITSDSFFRKSRRVRMRQVDAPQIVELTSSFGAWAVVFSAPTVESLRAQRALIHQISGMLPGVLAVHDLVGDTEAGACGALYAFLSRSRNADGSPQPLPDSTFLCVQCHPSRVLQDSQEPAAALTFGSGFVAAAKLVTAAFQTDEATPAWAAALQRQVEQSLSGYLGPEPANDRDKAAREGVVSALTKAMEVIAKHTRSTS